MVCKKLQRKGFTSKKDKEKDKQEQSSFRECAREEENNDNSS